jgi:hypothetical protein
MRDFVKLRDQLWLPKRVDVDCHTWFSIPDEISTGTLLHEAFSVERLDRAEIPLEQFRLKYTVRNTMIFDYTLPNPKHPDEGVSYLVPANPADLDAVIQHAVEGTPYRPTESLHDSTWSHRRTAFVLVNVAAIIVLIVIFLIRRRARAK